MKITSAKILLLLPLVVLNSCMSLVFNMKNKTPKVASRLPKFTVKDSLLGFNNDNRNCYDVKHYDIHLTFNTLSKSISGFVTTSFELVKNLDKIQLDLDERLKIDSIKQGLHHLAYKRTYTALVLDLISNEKEQAVTVYYHGKPLHAKDPPWLGGFVWKSDKNQKPFVGVACEGTGAQIWLPIKSYLGDEPDSVAMHFTVPNDLVVVSNGKLISVEENKFVFTKTYHWKTSYLINPYNITFYIGDYKLIEEPYKSFSGEEIKLSYYVLPENYEKAKTHFEQTGKILKVYEELFGNYPWPKDGYKLVESPYEGMEHQTAIAYGHGYKNEKNEDYDYIILHESAHEWWGNAVSVTDFSDVWIHEGIATYAEALYVERTKGYDAYLNYLFRTAIDVVNKKPVIGPTGVYYWNYKDGDPYSKGAVMLHTLRNHISNDSLFFTILQTFFKENYYKSTNTKAFIALVNQMTGKDLNLFFDQYLYHRESPFLKWNFDYDPDLKKEQIIFKFDRVVPGFTTPIEVEQGKDRFYIYPTTEVQFYTLPQEGTVPVTVNTKDSYLEEGFGKLEKVKGK